MARPLEGIKVVEVAMWAFVPAAGGILSDLGADVIKVEPPTGDPIRGLKIGMSNAEAAFDFSWENYNRGKRSITLDLKMPQGLEVLHKLLEDADVFLTNLLPPARTKMGIDLPSIRRRFPNIIYAVGSGVGQRGPEAHRGGFDAITFWARGGISSSLSAEDCDLPIAPPGPAFGDCLSGAMLAGAVSAAIAQRAMTGQASDVDVSLLGTAMWAMQRAITQSTHENLERFPRPANNLPNNPLVSNYRTKDNRFLALCMLQAQRYWAPLCEVAGRPDLAADPRYADNAARRTHLADCYADLKAMFASRTLAEWREILARQDGQWDVVQYVGEMKDDCQVQANDYLQPVTHEDGRTLRMVSVPMQFDGASLPASPAPELGADSDAILSSLGYDEDAIIDLKVAGVVF
ncbi:CoA transferase [Sphingobium sufflavum]|uniref:CaiB/BaiF CoA transferase family protein n=1 Tax=Sphingobium sufflavum TaxID=1129547 RepID=UPI001F3CF04C|nr:CoA transferase [Sphingobium sufflavum]MCE7795223.1 CoA transferase [Sphingobium sufflavum]